MPPEPLDAAILFAPVGSLVPRALEALDRGGTLAIAGIYLSDIPPLNYDRHLFEERTLRSVTANTRADGTTFLDAAARIGIKVSTSTYPFDDANAALVDLAQDRVNGAAVLVHPGQRTAARHVGRFGRVGCLAAGEVGTATVSCHLHPTGRIMRRTHDGNRTERRSRGESWWGSTVLLLLWRPSSGRRIRPS